MTAAGPHAFARRLAEGPALLLDGATGTELERLGLYTGLPLWCTHALIDHPDAVERVHRSHVDAGAEVLTACSFRTQRRVLARAGIGERTRELCHRAVDLARKAADAATDGRRVFVAGSAPSLEDCYRPDLVPPESELLDEHADHARHLADAGADLLLAETHHTLREARAALAAGRGTGLPVVVSFICDARARLLSGEPLAEALDAVTPLGPVAVGVNCLPLAAAAGGLSALAASGLPFAVHANLGAPNDETGFTRDADASPDTFAAAARTWLAAGARMVGGCCGTTPAHTRALAAAIHSDPAAA